MRTTLPQKQKNELMRNVSFKVTWIGQQYIAWMWTALGGGLHMDRVSAENLYQIQVVRFEKRFNDTSWL